MSRSILLFVVFYFGVAHAGESIIFQNGHIALDMPIKSWKTLRDFQVVKQDLDYSCGAASVVTILNEFYSQSVTEEHILKIMNKEDMRASFDDMARALKELGFRGIGYAASFEQLTKLKVPVIVYMKYRNDDHFSVLRGIDANTVWLADPSLGNRTYSRTQFMEMWETRESDQDNNQLKGKILAILPNKLGISAQDGFFTNMPSRQTAQAVRLQAIRPAP